MQKATQKIIKTLNFVYINKKTIAILVNCNSFLNSIFILQVRISIPTSRQFHKHLKNSSCAYFKVGTG